MASNEQSAEELVSDLKRVVQDSQELLHASAGSVGDKAQAMRQRLMEAVEAGKDMCRKLEEKAVAGAKATDRAIREHPYQSIGLAFGVGLLIGVLVTRK